MGAVTILSDPSGKVSSTVDAQQKVLIRRGRWPYVTDVPHILVADPGAKAAPYVLVTAQRGTVVYAVAREDVVGGLA